MIYIIVGVTVFVILSYTVGGKICIGIANALGVDPRNIPSKTYAVNGIYFGLIFGALAWIKVGVGLGIFVGIVGTLVGYVVIFLFEIAATKAVRNVTKPLHDRIDSRVPGHHETTQSIQSTWTCPKCKKENPMFYTTCECGGERSVEERPMVAPRAATQQYQSTWTCPNCRKENSLIYTRCECGEERQLGFRICPNCNSKERASHLQCYRCGTSLVDVEVVSE